MTETPETTQIMPNTQLDKPIDAFARQTPPEGTPPVQPTTVQKEGNENPSGDTPPTPPVVPPAQPPQVPAVTPKEEIDYKKKFGESTRQAQIIQGQFKELQKVLGDITKQEVPTDDEMRTTVPEWDMLSDREKNNERKLIVLERRQNHIVGTFHNISLEAENAEKIETLLRVDSRLAGREEAFTEFVNKPSNKGVPVEILANAFLFEVGVPTPTPAVPNTETPPSLERGTPSGGAIVPPANQEKTPEDLKALRTSNPKLYNEMIRKGQI